jgi:2-succinyl-5-enolpyruvyl-6-hydroxy-3-cyclohexene-1-carboxylate synthase
MIGDLAFLHDMNALALLRERPVTLVLVNNDGGGIFSFLPIAEHADVFEPWFTAPHGLTFEAAAGQFGLDHDAPGDSERFRAAYARALASGRGSVIEVRSERGANRRLHARIAAEASRLVRAR